MIGFDKLYIVEMENVLSKQRRFNHLLVREQVKHH